MHKVANVQVANEITQHVWMNTKVMKDKSVSSQDNADSGNIKSNYATLNNDVKCSSTTALACA